MTGISEWVCGVLLGCVCDFKQLFKRPRELFFVCLANVSRICTSVVLCRCGQIVKIDILQVKNRCVFMTSNSSKRFQFSSPSVHFVLHVLHGRLFNLSSVIMVIANVIRSRFFALKRYYILHCVYVFVCFTQHSSMWSGLKALARILHSRKVLGTLLVKTRFEKWYREIEKKESQWISKSV